MNVKNKTPLIILFLVTIALAFLAILFTNIASAIKSGEQALANLTLTDIDLSSIHDGTYIGEFKAGLVFAKVATTIEDKKITEIKLIEHQNGKGRAAESILNDMIAKQTTDVVMVSGATISSKVIRKAIENSLVQN